MTTPSPAPDDREALAELVNGRPLPPDNTVGGAHERESALLRADAILARWQLVPVDQAHPRHDLKGEDGEECQCWGAGYEEGVYADVHG